MLKAVIAAVKKVAQQEIMPRYLKVAHQRKTDGSIFTEADIAAQTALVSALKQIHDYPVLGEEMLPEQQEALWRTGEDGLWCIDPIDGTSNFFNGLPYFAVSVALMRGGQSVLGVIYDPVADEMFWAERGKGAYLNGEPMPIKECAPEFHHAMAAIDFKRLKPNLAQQLVASPPFASQRNFGASTLDWCYVAAGRAREGAGARGPPRARPRALPRTGRGRRPGGRPARPRSRWRRLDPRLATSSRRRAPTLAARSPARPLPGHGSADRGPARRGGPPHLRGFDGVDRMAPLRPGPRQGQFLPRPSPTSP